MKSVAMAIKHKVVFDASNTFVISVMKLYIFILSTIVFLKVICTLIINHIEKNDS